MMPIKCKAVLLSTAKNRPVRSPLRNSAKLIDQKNTSNPPPNNPEVFELPVKMVVLPMRVNDGLELHPDHNEAGTEKNDVVPVTVFGNALIQLSQINLSTVRFGKDPKNAGAAAINGVGLADTGPDGTPDGNLDADMEFLMSGTGLDASCPAPRVEVQLIGATNQGTWFIAQEMVDVKCALFFGSYHNVDSSEAAFKMAARKALKGAIDNEADKLRPVILEPIMKVKIVVPQTYMGDVMGDVSTRRGALQGTDADGPYQVIIANIPEDELYQYATSLRSFTQGTGIFTMEFSHYAEVPGDVQKRLVDDFKKTQTAEE